MIRNRLQIEIFFWFDFIKNTQESMINTIFCSYGIQPFLYKTLEEKIDRLNCLIEQNHICMIIDNIERKHLKLPIIKAIFQLPVMLILISREYLHSSPIHQVYQLSCFSEEEFYKFSENILGKNLFQQYKNSVDTIGKNSGYLPAVVSYNINSLLKNQDNLQKINNQKLNDIASLEHIIYEKRNLQSSLVAVFSWMSDLEREIILFLARYKGSFSVDALFADFQFEITRIVQGIESLKNKGIVESVGNDTYRVHPVIKIFVNNNYSQR